MYAVIDIKGSQFKVEKGDNILVNRLETDDTGKLKVDTVLFGKKGNSYFIGEPFIKGAHVECDVIGDKRLKKIIVFKYRERKSSQSKKGHRQDVTELKIKDIHFEE